MSDALTETNEPQKKSLLGKLVKWSITLLVLVVIANFIVGLRSDQKDNFVKGVRTNAEQRCLGDTACLATLKTKFSQCLDENSESHKSGKYSRKYTLDDDGFYNCVR